MAAISPSIQFFENMPEDLDGVSLRRNQTTGTKIVCFIFKQLHAIEQFNSYRKQFSKALRLVDEEGELLIEPSSVKFIFGGPEGDDFERLECKFEIDRDDHWERFMRFMHRYAAANGMTYGEN